MIKIFSTFVVLFFSNALIAKNETFKIKDVEELGFVKDTEKGFEHIGAIDGWGGSWNDERVEIYEYENAEKLNAMESFFNVMLDIGWKEVCLVSNLGMMSKGESSCSQLKELISE